MNSAAIPGGIMLGVEAGIALAITLVMILFAALAIRPQHRDCARWHVLVGAGIQGAVYGVIVGFFIMPLRFALIEGSVPAGLTGPSFAIAVGVMIALRRGLFSHLPFLGPQIRAYRRAMLRRTIETSERQLSKLTTEAAGGAA